MCAARARPDTLVYTSAYALCTLHLGAQGRKAGRGCGPTLGWPLPPGCLADRNAEQAFSNRQYTCVCWLHSFSCSIWDVVSVKGTTCSEQRVWRILCTQSSQYLHPPAPGTSNKHPCVCVRCGVAVCTLLYNSVTFNYLGRDFFNALSEKDVVGFKMQLIKYLIGFCFGEQQQLEVAVDVCLCWCCVAFGDACCWPALVPVCRVVDSWQTQRDTKATVVGGVLSTRCVLRLCCVVLCAVLCCVVRRHSCVRAEGLLSGAGGMFVVSWC